MYVYFFTGAEKGNIIQDDLNIIKQKGYLQSLKFSTYLCEKSIMQ